MADQYWVTGADGREYGPVTLDALVRWVREGRVVAHTQVRAGEASAVEARTLPELASYFMAAPSISPGGTAAPAALPAQFEVWDLIGRAWDLVKPNWLPLALMSFIWFALGCVPYLGWCVQFIIGGAIAVGIWRAILGMIDGRPPAVGMMFEGFDRFGDAFLAYLVRVILTSLGFLLLIVPGIILAVMWCFTFPVLAETPLGFWEAMRRSAVLTEGYRWRLFMLALACFLVILLGLVAFCVGVFVAVPVCATAFALAYRFLKARQAGSVPASPAPSAPAPSAPAPSSPVAGA